MLENVMNPLSLSEKNLLCAFDEASGNLVGFGQIRPLSHVDGSDCKHFELASVFVKPEYRSKGIGSDLVRELLLRFDETDEALGSSIYLLTLQPTKQFYEQFGFKVVEDNEKVSLPSTLQFELSMGKIISSILGNQLICMQR